MDKLNLLKIIAVNANSIVTNERRYNLLQFTSKHNPDIILLSETKLTLTTKSPSRITLYIAKTESTQH